MATPTKTTGLFVRYLAPHRARVAGLAVLLLASMGIPLVGPQILREFIDTAQAGGTTGTLARYAVLYLGVGLASTVVFVATVYLSEHVGWTATNDLREDLCRHSLDLDMAFHNTHTPGEMIERIDGDVSALSNFFSEFVISILGSVLFLAGILALTFREDAGIGLALVLFSAVSLGVMTKLRRIAVPASTAQRESSAELFGFLEERLAGVDDIRANGAGEYVMRGFALASRVWLGRLVWSEKVGVLIWTASTVLFGASLVLVLSLGGHLYRREAITVGTVFMLFQYVMMLDHPLSNIAAQMKDFQKAAAGIGRVRDLVALSSAIPDGDRELPSGPLAVALEGVRFGYGDIEAVLDDVSFTLAPGEVCGVVGRTGSGKTTIARLLLRLYDVEAGSVRIGDVDVRDARLADLRRRVAVVTQDVQLFQGSVRDNVTLFDASIPDEAIVAVLDDLGLGRWWRQVDGGLDGEVASAGQGLSAGEGQLLAFARVFLRDPGLVILDEASSRLDPATEAHIEHATDRLLEQRTALVIAHRLRTVERADVILVLDDGRVAELGRRTELARDPGSRFSQLLSTGMEEVLV